MTLFTPLDKTLTGFFPVGAFNEHATKEWILVAHEGETLAGYLLYRITGQHEMHPRAVIVHLCIAEKYRGRGIARLLVDALRNSVQSQVYSITLRCRSDYDANSLWPELGFVYRGERVGRSNKPLAIWWMQLRRPPLLALLDSKVDDSSHLSVVLDANVLYRLQDPIPHDDDDQRLMSEEAKSLEADWIGDEIELFKTNEIFNELQKQDDRELRLTRISFVSEYNTVQTNLEKVRRWELRLQEVFPENPNSNTKSDIRHLAHTIAGGVTFFLTQDEGILKRSSEIYEKSGLRILTPGELIGRLDEAIREVEYQPKRLAGIANIMGSRLPSDQVTDLYPHLRCLPRREKIHEFFSFR
jgi:predicted nucleic acid-binding protein/GNAT superfamily N-acetyltransferase